MRFLQYRKELYSNRTASLFLYVNTSLHSCEHSYNTCRSLTPDGLVKPRFSMFWLLYSCVQLVKEKGFLVCCRYYLVLLIPLGTPSALFLFSCGLLGLYVGYGCCVGHGLCHRAPRTHQTASATYSRALSRRGVLVSRRRLAGYTAVAGSPTCSNMAGVTRRHFEPLRDTIVKAKSLTESLDGHSRGHGKHPFFVGNALQNC